MNLSIIFAQIMGFYLVLVSIGILIHHQRYRKVGNEFLASHALIAVSGNMGLIWGLIILVTHQVWVPYWPVIITLIGWFLVLRGALSIFLPTVFVKYSKELTDKRGFFIWTWVCLVVGLYLLILGFTH